VRQIKVVVEKYPDGYVAYPLGLKDVIVGEGDSYEEALADVKSAVAFHKKMTHQALRRTCQPAPALDQRPNPCLTLNAPRHTAQMPESRQSSKTRSAILGLQRPVGSLLKVQVASSSNKPYTLFANSWPSSKSASRRCNFSGESFGKRDFSPLSAKRRTVAFICPTISSFRQAGALRSNSICNASMRGWVSGKRRYMAIKGYSDWFILLYHQALTQQVICR
jgi:predicted RNase H-like HicB family nuclease